MHKIGHVGRRPRREQTLVKKMRVHSVSGFSNLVKAFFEWCILCLLPPAEGIVRNPMFRKSAIDQAVQIATTILRLLGFNEVEDTE